MVPISADAWRNPLERVVDHRDRIAAKNEDLRRRLRRALGALRDAHKSLAELARVIEEEERAQDEDDRRGAPW